MLGAQRLLLHAPPRHDSMFTLSNLLMCREVSTTESGGVRVQPLASVGRQVNNNKEPQRTTTPNSKQPLQGPAAAAAHSSLRPATCVYNDAGCTLAARSDQSA